MAKQGPSVKPKGETIIEDRNRRGWTQEELADKARVSAKTIGDAERSEKIRFSSLEKIATALGFFTQRYIRDDAFPALRVIATDQERSRIGLEIDESRIEPASIAELTPQQKIKHVQGIKLPLKTLIGMAHKGLLTEEALNQEVTIGSVILWGDVTHGDISRIVRAFLRGKLKSLGIKSIRINDTRIDARLETTDVSGGVGQVATSKQSQSSIEAPTRTQVIAQSDAKNALRQGANPVLRKLIVEETDEAITLRGEVASYFDKNMAQETVRPVLRGRELRNLIRIVLVRGAMIPHPD